MPSSSLRLWERAQGKVDVNFYDNFSLINWLERFTVYFAGILLWEFFNFLISFKMRAFIILLAMTSSNDSAMNFAKWVLFASPGRLSSFQLTQFIDKCHRILHQPNYRKSSTKPLGGLFNFGHSRGGLLERGLIQKVR